MFEEKNLPAFRITSASQYLDKGTTYSLFSSLCFFYVITIYVLASCSPKQTPKTDAFQTIWEFRNNRILPMRGPRLWNLIPSLVY